MIPLRIGLYIRVEFGSFIRIVNFFTDTKRGRRREIQRGKKREERYLLGEEQSGPYISAVHWQVPSTHVEFPKHAYLQVGISKNRKIK